jgi:hypothetical protein
LFLFVQAPGACRHLRLFWREKKHKVLIFGRNITCVKMKLRELLSAGAIANVAATATAAPVPSAVIAATAAYFSATVNTASMFQRFRLPLCFNVSAAAAAAASVSIAIATIVLACRSFGASGGRWQRTP